MKILILAGIKEELAAIFKNIPFRYDAGIKAYKSTQFEYLYAATTGPGLRGRKKINALLKAITPHVIINAGLVGILNGKDNARVGDRIEIGIIKALNKKEVFNESTPGDGLITVERPVFDLDEKMELYLSHKARVCDMEAFHLLSFIEEKKKSENKYSPVKIRFCKIVGDIPSDWRLFQKEEAYRALGGAGVFKKAIGILFFPGGIVSWLRLRVLKKKALNSLGEEVEREVKGLIDTAGDTDI